MLVLLGYTETPEEITAIFNFMDDDPKNDYVSIAEMKAAGVDLDEEDEEFKNNFREADTDKDQRLSLEG